MIQRGELKAPSTLDTTRSQGMDRSIIQGQKRGRTYGKGGSKDAESWRTYADELSETTGTQIPKTAPKH